MNLRQNLWGLVLASALPVNSTAAVASTMQDVSLQFAGEFAGQAADCDTSYADVGVVGTAVGIADYRLYISRVRLLDADGKETPVTLIKNGPWQHENVALLDFENGSGNCSNGTAPTNSVIKGQVPAGEYRGVAFDIGVPFDKNHKDPSLAASPLNLTALFWNWRGGYRFLRVDLIPDGQVMSSRSSLPNDASKNKLDKAVTENASESVQPSKTSGAASTLANWSFHLGSTACVADSPTSSPELCKSPNRLELVFPEADPKTSLFVIDPALVLSASDVTRNTEGTSPGCMSGADDPECAPIFKALGLSPENTVQALVSVR